LRRDLNPNYAEAFKQSQAQLAEGERDGTPDAVKSPLSSLDDLRF
jgi:hypothetical protein